MLNASTTETFGSSVVIRLAECSLGAAVLLAIAGLMSVALYRAPARARHLLWITALLTTLALPLLALALPSWHWTAPGPDAIATAPTVAPSLPTTAAALDPATHPAPTHAPSVQAADRATAPAAASMTVPWAAIILVAWLLGAARMLGRLALSLRAALRLVNDAVPVDGPRWTGLLSELRAQLPVARPVRLLRSDRVGTAMTAGWIRPVVLLPAESDSWSEERCRWVLLHELVHVQRRDWLTLLAAQLARALHWFNPLAWIAVDRLVLEQERACDDSVVGFGARRSDYATHLVELARSLHRASPAAAIAMASPSRLTRRVSWILDGTRSSGSRLSIVVPALLLATVALPVAAMKLEAAPERTVLLVGPRSGGKPLVAVSSGGDSRSLTVTELSADSPQYVTATSSGASAAYDVASGDGASGYVMSMGKDGQPRVHALPKGSRGYAVTTRDDGSEPTVVALPHDAGGGPHAVTVGADGARIHRLPVGASGYAYQVDDSGRTSAYALPGGLGRGRFAVSTGADGRPSVYSLPDVRDDQVIAFSSTGTGTTPSVHVLPNTGPTVLASPPSTFTPPEPPTPALAPTRPREPARALAPEPPLEPALPTPAEPATLPTLPVTPLPPEPTVPFEHAVSSDNRHVQRARGGLTVTRRADGRTLRMVVTDVDSLTFFRNGYTALSPKPGELALTLEEDVRRGPDRKLEMRVDADGQLVHDFWIDGRFTEFDDDARQWMHETLGECFDLLRSGSD